MEYSDRVKLNVTLKMETKITNFFLPRRTPWCRARNQISKELIFSFTGLEEEESGGEGGMNRAGANADIFSNSAVTSPPQLLLL
jgi:hypothetical protein